MAEPGRERQEPRSPAWVHVRACKKSPLTSEAVFQIWEPRGRAGRLPGVEQENRRRHFLPPDLQSWRIFDTQTTLGREAQLWPCRCSAGRSTSCPGGAGRCSGCPSAEGDSQTLDLEQWEPPSCLKRCPLPAPPSAPGTPMDPVGGLGSAVDGRAGGNWLSKNNKALAPQGTGHRAANACSNNRLNAVSAIKRHRSVPWGFKGQRRLPGR